MKEYQTRSLIKAVSWRIIATLTTTTLIYIFTGKLDLAVGVGLLEMTLKMLFYYLHERVWERISWGRIKHPLEGLPVTQELTPEDFEIIRQNLKDLGYI